MKTAYFCGVDISKDSFCIAIKNERFITKDTFFNMDKEGFEKFDAEVRDFKDNLLVGMEATGIYHNNLFDFLQNRGYNSCIVNPYRMHQFFKFTNNKPTKTDKKDAKTICEFLEFKEREIEKSTNMMDSEKSRIRHFVREKENITSEIAKTKTEIKRIVSLTFPEIENKISLFSKEILYTLPKFPSADSIRKTTKGEFVKGVFNKGKGRNIKICMDEIYRLALNSIAGHFPLYEELLKIKIKRLLHLEKEREDITEIIDKMGDRYFKREIEILTSIPGIGRASAIYFMAEIVDIKGFSGYRKLIGFCGLDPVIKQSGKYKGAFRISKRGNSHARRVMWIMAGCVKRSCPYFREYYLMKRDGGKSYKEAVIAVSTKLLRVIHALLNENRTFK